MILIDQVKYGYPNTREPILPGVSMSVERGELVALTGKNGCGKTTLTRLIVGMLRPGGGKIVIDDQDIAGMDLFEIGRRVGYIFQNPSRQLFCQTVREEIGFGLKNQGKDGEDTDEAVNGLLDLFRLRELEESFPGTLSFGEKQRTALAAVLAMGTDYLVLDEPTAGLDVKGRRELADMLTGLAGEKNCGILFVSHERDFITRCAAREVVLHK